MTPVHHPVPQVGDLAPDCALPGGTRLFELRGQPVVLAFAPDEWNPAHAYASEVFAQLSREFNGAAWFVDVPTDGWHSLDCQGELAARLGVEGRRALLLLDEEGVLRWKLVVPNGEQIHPGQVLAALESLRTPASPDGTLIGPLSRRGFLTATLAAAAVLSLAGAGAHAAPTANPAPRPRTFPDGTNSPNANDPAVPVENTNRTGTIPVTLRVNGQKRQLQLEPRVALLDALRENLHLTGTKKGCDHGQCGACTVHIDGQSQLSCLVLAVMAQGKEIGTIEGLASGETLHPLQSAFIQHDAFQCGYCTPGQLMAASALLADKRHRSEAEIREAMSGNLCRCAAYPNIIAAIAQTQSA